MIMIPMGKSKKEKCRIGEVPKANRIQRMKKTLTGFGVEQKLESMGIGEDEVD